MQVPFEAREFVGPDQMSAAAGYVDREHGSCGYKIGVAETHRLVAIFEVRHFDGSTFNLLVDKWGNVRRIEDDASRERIEDAVVEMTEVAAIP